jgi:hypothetical protein
LPSNALQAKGNRSRAHDRKPASASLTSAWLSPTGELHLDENARLLGPGPGLQAQIVRARN